MTDPADLQRIDENARAIEVERDARLADVARVQDRIAAEHKDRQAVEAVVAAHTRTDLAEAVADVYRSIESLRARVARAEATTEQHASLLVLKTLPDIQTEFRLLSGGQADLLVKVRNLMKHFRPWPKNDDGGRCTGC